jgi:ankyrin repeat protein
MKGIDVNVQNNEGDTPLHLAIRNSDKKIIQLLLDCGSEVDRVNKKNENVVEIAQVIIYYKIYFNILLNLIIVV